jgi:hypothetical protein
MTTLGDNFECFRPASMQQSAADTLGLISDTVDSTLPRWRGGHKWRRRTSDAVSAVGGSGGGGHGPHARVQYMWTAMRTLLQCASLHVLDPGAEEMMQSSAVLLWGSLVAASDPSVKRLKRSPGTAKAPCALVWAGKQEENATAGVVEVRAGTYATCSVHTGILWCLALGLASSTVPTRDVTCTVLMAFCTVIHCVLECKLHRSTPKTHTVMVTSLVPTGFVCRGGRGNLCGL